MVPWFGGQILQCRARGANGPKFPPNWPITRKLWAPVPSLGLLPLPKLLLERKNIASGGLQFCALALSMSGMLLGSLVWWANFTMSRQGCKWPKISPQLAHYQGKFGRRCPAWVFYRCPKLLLERKTLPVEGYNFAPLALSMSGMLLGSLVWWANFTMSRQGCKWPKISPQLAHYQGKFGRRCPAWVF